MTAAEPAVKSATAYYEANIGKVTSDRRISSATIGSCPTRSTPTDSATRSTPGRSSPRCWRAASPIRRASRTPSRMRAGKPSPRRSTFSARAWHPYLRRARSRRRPPTMSSSSSRAIRARRMSASSLRSTSSASRRPSPTNTASSPIKNLLEVAQTIFGLSPATSATNIDTQAKILSKLMPVSDLQDPKKLQQLTQRFTAMYDLTYGPDSGATTSLAVRRTTRVRARRRRPRCCRASSARTAQSIGKGAQSLHRRADTNVLQRADDEPAEVHA